MGNDVAKWNATPKLLVDKTMIGKGNSLRFLKHECKWHSRWPGDFNDGNVLHTLATSLL
jgi:hypothetical protein